MSGASGTFDQGTDHTAARRRFGLWSLGLFILFLPPWWLWGADLALAALKPLANLALKLVNLTGVVETAQDGGWMVGTHLTRQGAPITFHVPHTVLRRLLLGIPIVAAFLLAPPRTPRLLRAAVISVASLAVLFLVSLMCLIWGDLASQLNPELATARHATRASLDQAPLHPILAQVAIVGRYIGLSIAPLVTAALLWAGLNPGGRSLLMDDGSLKETPED